MELQLTTELAAVNSMLQTIGEVPVNTLDVTGLTDAAIAQDVLAEVTREVLCLGLWFNTDYGFTLAPAADNKIAIGADMLRVRATDGRRLVIRNGYLYDVDAQANTFTQEVKADVVWSFPFDELPESARRFIVVRSARLFQDRVMSDKDIHGFTDQDEADARGALIAEDREFFPADGTDEASIATAVVSGLVWPVGKVVVPPNRVSKWTAVSLVRRARDALLGMGLACNTIRGVQLPRDPDGTVPVPDTVLSISGGTYVVKDGKLFDVRTQTDTFATDDDVPELTVLYRMPLEYLPEPARRLVLIWASREFQDRSFGNKDMHEFSLEQERQARVDLAAYDREAHPADSVSTEGIINTILNSLRDDGRRNLDIARGRYSSVVASTLESVRRAVLARGWVFNTDEDGNYTDLALEDLPDLARQYILIRTTRVVQDGINSTQAIHRYSTDDEERAYAELVTANTTAAGANFIADDIDTNDIWSR